jgi:predicted site-specific integrase-resolvase
MNVMAPARTAGTTGNHPDGDLMTRRQVAYLFRVTSAAVANWARSGRLPEVRDENGRPRYRRADVEALYRACVERRLRAQAAVVRVAGPGRA